MKMITVFCIDMNQHILDCFNAILSQDKDIRVVGSSPSVIGAMETIDALRPDVVVAPVDSQPADNHAIIRFLTASLNAKVLATSTYADSRYALWAVDAGASGYILKDRASDDLVTAIHRIFSGRIFISPGIAGILN